jgi:excisionase family DNA binding protein
MRRPSSEPLAESREEMTTLEVAKELGMAVRSVQLMVDRGELQAWKTPGGHRRIARASLLAWMESRSNNAQAAGRMGVVGNGAGQEANKPCVLLIEDSRHYQTLIRLIIEQSLPQVELHIADDGIAGLAMAGRLQPEVLLVDILLPGIDGATLVTSLRSHPTFTGSQLIVVTSLDETQRQPYAYALQGVPVASKERLAVDLPELLSRALAR